MPDGPPDGLRPMYAHEAPCSCGSFDWQLVRAVANGGRELRLGFQCAGCSTYARGYFVLTWALCGCARCTKALEEGRKL